MSKNKIIYLSTAVIFLVIALIFITINNSNDEAPSEKKAVNKNLLVGNWVRTDASYLIKIVNVNVDGTLGAQYFNPKSINVGTATWEENYGNLKIIVELQDVNYPGSTYSLSYLPDRKILAGEYYQAVQRSTFYVEFARSK